MSRQGPVIELNVHGHTEYHIIRQELSFTSERRRMSVVVQDRATGTLTLYMKGWRQRILFPDVKLVI